MKTSMFLFVVMVLLSSCTYENHLPYYDSGMVEVIEELPSIWKLENVSNDDLFITSQPGGAYIHFRGTERDLQRISYSIHNGCLDWYDSGSSRSSITINIPYWTAIGNFGSGDVLAEAPPNTSQIELLSESSGDVDVYHVDADACFVTTRGSGDIFLSGYSRLVDAITHSSGDIRAFKLQATEAITTTQGSGDIRLSVRDILDARIFASGDIIIRGYPLVQLDDRGSGDLFTGR